MYVNGFNQKKDSKQAYNSSTVSRQNIIHSFSMSTRQCIRDYSLTESFVYWPRIEWQSFFFFDKWPLWTKYFQDDLTLPYPTHLSILSPPLEVHFCELCPSAQTIRISPKTPLIVLTVWWPVINIKQDQRLSLRLVCVSQHGV